MKNEVEEGMEKEQTLKKPQGVKSALERVSSRHGIHFHRHGSLQTEFEKTLENPSMPKELVMDNIRADNKVFSIQTKRYRRSESFPGSGNACRRGWDHSSP
jgi:hypothetical protein